MEQINQWQGKCVAFLGDSITDKIGVGTTKIYWQYLEESLKLEALPYGQNGCQWLGGLEQAKRLYEEHGSRVDAISIFLGTNDYNSSVPPGDFFELRTEETNAHGYIHKRLRRIFSEDPATVCGRINTVLRFLKEHFPESQILLLTPIHRGYARFGDVNVQPEESYPNDLGLFVEEYVRLIKRAGEIWSVPVIDLFTLAGLFPMNDSHCRYFHKEDTDRLHPNALGHARIARTLYYQMLALPSTFRDL